MNNDVKIKYMNKKNNFSGVYYLIGTIAFGAAPTIENIKPSSVLTLGSRLNLLENWLEHSEWICDFLGLEYYTLRKRNGSYTVLFYKKNRLQSHLQLHENHQFLSMNGYDDSLSKQLVKLKANYIQSFPHEIGIFLGIPLKDVEGFIENTGKNYLLNGYWKVYYNVKEAIEIFHKYDLSRIKVINELQFCSKIH